MQWYYSANGKQQGPVSQAEFDTLVRTGAIGRESLVWRDGMANWTPYSAVAASVVNVAEPAPAGMARCVECGQTFRMDDMVKFEQSYVCATCKPLFFQKVREGVPVGNVEMWRYKKQLVTRLNPVLPARCVKCNAPTSEPQKKRNLYWHSPLVYIALFVNVILYVVIALIVRKRSTAMLSICQEHRTKRRNVIIISWLMVLVGFGSFFAAAAYESGWIVAVGIALILGGIIYGIVKGRLIYPTKMDNDRVWIAGCGKEFLAEFPEWTGA
jgi:hypothetical protein